MSNIWDLLPAGVASRAKSIVALIGAVAFIVVSFYPSLADNHYVSVAIGVLTVFGVWGVPNSNSGTAALRKAELNPYLAPGYQEPQDK